MPTLKDKPAAVHPLIGREVRPPRNWTEFLIRWESAGTHLEMLGLLHGGFTVSLTERLGEGKYDYIDRIIFYLSIAHGWSSSVLLQCESDLEQRAHILDVDHDRYGNAVSRMTLSQLRQQVARKAFDMLCLNFFRDIKLLGRGHLLGAFSYDWEVIVSGRFFPVLQDFFKEQKGDSGDVEILNLPNPNERPTNNVEHMVEFLLNLARFLWGWTEGEQRFGHLAPSTQAEEAERLVGMRSRIDRAKPWMIEILDDLNRFDVLRQIRKLDDHCLAKLEEIAMRALLNKHDAFFKRRRVKTLGEACLADSPAALFLNEYTVRARAYERLGKND